MSMYLVIAAARSEHQYHQDGQQHHDGGGDGVEQDILPVAFYPVAEGVQSVVALAEPPEQGGMALFFHRGNGVRSYWPGGSGGS